MEHEPEEEVDEATNDPCDNVHDGSVVHGWLAGCPCLCPLLPLFRAKEAPAQSELC